MAKTIEPPIIEVDTKYYIARNIITDGLGLAARTNAANLRGLEEPDVTIVSEGHKYFCYSYPRVQEWANDTDGRQFNLAEAVNDEALKKLTNPRLAAQIDEQVGKGRHGSRIFVTRNVIAAATKRSYSAVKSHKYLPEPAVVLLGGALGKHETFGYDPVDVELWAKRAGFEIDWDEAFGEGGLRSAKNLAKSVRKHPGKRGNK